MGDEKSHRFLLIGPPGSGKGTYANRLAQRFGVPHIATGDMLRKAVESNTELSRKVKSYLDKGELVPDDVMIEMIRERLLQEDARKGFSLDGFPRTLEQARMLDELMKSMGADFDYVFHTWAPVEYIVERTIQRVQCERCGRVYNIVNNPPKNDNICDFCGGNVYQREDDSEEMIRKRMRVFEEKTAPIIAHYEKHPRYFKVDTRGRVGLAEDEMLRIIEGIEGVV